MHSVIYGTDESVPYGISPKGHSEIFLCFLLYKITKLMSIFRVF